MRWKLFLEASLLVLSITLTAVAVVNQLQNGNTISDTTNNTEFDNQLQNTTSNETSQETTE